MEEKRGVKGKIGNRRRENGKRRNGREGRDREVKGRRNGEERMREIENIIDEIEGMERV